MARRPWRSTHAGRSGGDAQGAADSLRPASRPAEEFLEVEPDELLRRSQAQLHRLVELARPDLERELGRFEIVSTAGVMRLRVGEIDRYRVGTTRSGRLLLTDISGRFARYL